MATTEPKQRFFRAPPEMMRLIFTPTLTLYPLSPPDTDNPLDTSGTLVSSLRMYSAGKNSATAGRHDVAVESFTEVSAPLGIAIS